MVMLLSSKDVDIYRTVSLEPAFHGVPIGRRRQLFFQASGLDSRPKATLGSWTSLSTPDSSKFHWGSVKDPVPVPHSFCPFSKHMKWTLVLFSFYRGRN